MSSSYNTEQELRRLSEKLAGEAALLQEAALLLERVRDAKEHSEEIKSLKDRVADWLKR